MLNLFLAEANCMARKWEGQAEQGLLSEEGKAEA